MLSFRPYPGESVVVNAAGARNAIRISGTHDVAIRGFTVRGAGVQYGAGVLVENATRVLIASTRLVSNRSIGAQIVSSSRVTIRDSLISGNETGVQVSYDGAGRHHPEHHPGQQPDDRQ